MTFQMATVVSFIGSGISSFQNVRCWIWVVVLVLSFMNGIIEYFPVAFSLVVFEVLCQFSQRLTVAVLSLIGRSYFLPIPSFSSNEIKKIDLFDVDKNNLDYISLLHWNNEDINLPICLVLSATVTGHVASAAEIRDNNVLIWNA